MHSNVQLLYLLLLFAFVVDVAVLILKVPKNISHYVHFILVCRVLALRTNRSLRRAQLQVKVIP